MTLVNAIGVEARDPDAWLRVIRSETNGERR